MKYKLVIAIATLFVVAIVAFFLTRRRKENFSFGSIFGKIKDGVVGIGKKTASVATGLVNKVTGGGGGYVPTWAYREWNGRTWSCPAGSTDYGSSDDNQCLTSPYGPQKWRWDSTANAWNWSCPAGTTPNNSDDWNQKCIAGYSGRKSIDGAWKCTDTETDTGATWENSDWFGGFRQCQRSDTVFTRRMNIGGKWQCPPETTDTGFTWTDGDNGSKQCQYSAG